LIDDDEIDGFDVGFDDANREGLNVGLEEDVIGLLLAGLVVGRFESGLGVLFLVGFIVGSFDSGLNVVGFIVGLFETGLRVGFIVGLAVVLLGFFVGDFETGFDVGFFVGCGLMIASSIRVDIMIISSALM
jgi:hypothetical protein